MDAAIREGDWERLPRPGCRPQLDLVEYNRSGAMDLDPDPITHMQTTMTEGDWERLERIVRRPQIDLAVYFN